MFRSRFFLSSTTKLTLCYTLIYPYISIRLKSPNSCFIIEITYCLHCFLNLFVTNGKIHNYGTRTASNYRTHLCRTNLNQFTILYQGPNIWNSLPVPATRLTNLLSFKTKMQEFLLK
ncbi:unnamed protein product [Pocillopora meandrina]|uniref:Uncharacterized protein n=1 Tax=Pocillopora meandrina TaxID=46732 RepID=A0AAU9X510_9CNID|nr:unnamed protein product [Pocillopora meandrina]